MNAEIPRAEYEQLKSAYPQAAAKLDQISELGQVKAVVLLDALSASDLDEFGAELNDTLFSYVWHQSFGQFSSYFFQLNEVLKVPRSQAQPVLEVGPGHGILTAVLRSFGYEVTTLDYDPAVKPDVAGIVTDMPFEDGSFGVVCAFQVLQHLPFEDVGRALSELARCSRRHVLLSVPDETNSLRFELHGKTVFPIIGRRSFAVDMFQLLPGRYDDRQSVPPGRRAHYWETNRRSTPPETVLTEIERAGLNLVSQFHNPHHPYHRFLKCTVRLST